MKKENNSNETALKIAIIAGRSVVLFLLSLVGGPQLELVVAGN